MRKAKLRVCAHIWIMGSLWACGAGDQGSNDELGRGGSEPVVQGSDAATAVADRGGAVAAELAMRDSLRSVQDSMRGELVAMDSLFALVGDWRFEPRAGEQMAIDSALGTLVGEPFGPDLSYSGTIYRLGAEPAGDRYLLFAVLPDTTGTRGDQWGLSFYVLERSGSELKGSEPYVLGIGLDSSLAQAEARADFDGDGLWDIALCRWPVPYPLEPDSTYVDPPGEVEVIGYRGGQWYHIEEPAPPPPPCG